MKLSDLDPKDIEVVSEPEDAPVTRLSDLDPSEVEVVEPEAVKPSKLESFGRGARQGATMGFAEEAGAGLGAGLDVGQRLLNELGLAGPSPSQVSEQLKSQGATGDIGPTDTTEMYQALRDEERAAEKAAMEANPLAYGAGTVTGGIAASPLMPTALTAPVQAAKGAGLAARVGASAASAVPTGLIAGAGMSEADLTSGQSEDAYKALMDSIMGGMTGAAVGGAIPLAGAALGKTKQAAGTLIPEQMKGAFKKGQAGIDITSPEFYEETTKKALQTSEDVATPILQKIQTQQVENAAKVAQLDDQLNALNKQTENAVKLGEARQIAQNADDIKAIDKETVGLAKNIQKRVFDVKKELGKQYDEIDAAAEATGVIPENRDVIGNFQETLTNMSGLPETEVNSIMKKMTPVLGDKTIQGFRNTKQALSNYFEHANPVVRRAAKQAYSNLKSNYANDLTQAGHGGIASRLADTNKRWSAVNELEEQFLSNLKPSRVTGEIEASPDTIRAISKAGGKNAIEMAETEQLGKLMGVLDPDQAGQTMGQMQQMATRAAEAKAFKPEVPVLPNPEVARLESMLAQAKLEKPKGIPGLDVSTSSAASLKDELLSLIPKVDSRSGDEVAEKRIAQIFDFIKKEQGEEAANKLQQEVSGLAKDVNLRNLANRQRDKIPGTLSEVGEKVAGGALGLANKAGMMLSKPRNTTKLKDTVLKKGVKTLTESTPEQLDEVATAMQTLGPEGAGFAKVLGEAKSKNVNSKNAIIFGLMQQPKFREMLRKLNGEEQDETENGETE